MADLTKQMNFLSITEMEEIKITKCKKKTETTLELVMNNTIPILATNERREGEISDLNVDGNILFEKAMEKLDSNETKEAAQLLGQGAQLDHFLCQKFYLNFLVEGLHVVEKNVDEGLKLALKLAFKGDYDSKCSFNEINPNILKQGGIEEAYFYYKNL